MNTQKIKQQLKHALAVQSRTVASAALAVRMAVVPLVPFSTTVVGAADEPAEPPQITATLSVRQAPVQLNADEPTMVTIEVGESTVQRVAREAKEAEEARLRAEVEARLAAEQAQKDAVARFVVARYSPVRDNGGLTIEQARDMTVFYAHQYGVDPVLMSKLVACESGYNQLAKNSRSTASGYGQFLAGTWRSTIAALGWDPSTSVFDGERNLEAMAYLISVRGTSPWNSSRGCWAR